MISELPGHIRHERSGERWEHPNDILTRLECDACSNLIMKLLMKRLGPEIGARVDKAIIQHWENDHYRP